MDGNQEQECTETKAKESLDFHLTEQLLKDCVGFFLRRHRVPPDILLGYVRVATMAQLIVA